MDMPNDLVISTITELVQYYVQDELDNYNNFFYPNLCHVCKRGIQGYHILCECKMIQYCSKLHQEVHKIEHLQFCQDIRNYFIKKNMQILNCFVMSRSEWYRSRYIIVCELNENIKSLSSSRELESYEKQMIIFARSCDICHRQTDLRSCAACFSVDYCVEHIEDLVEHRFTTLCHKMLLCVNINISSLGFPRPFRIKFTSFPPELTNTEVQIPTMDEFITNYVRPYFPTDRPAIIGWTAREYDYSDYVSGPLTFYYGILNVGLAHQLTNRYHIHILAHRSHSLENEYSNAWELILHTSRGMKELNITLLNLQFKKKEELVTCFECKGLHDQKLYFSNTNLTYVDFLSYTLYEDKPNALIIFQADFNIQLLLTKILESDYLKKLEACQMFLLTNTSKHIAQQNKYIIKHLTGVTPAWESENKLHSLRLWRDSNPDTDTDLLVRRNEYITVYKDLFTILNPPISAVKSHRRSSDTNVAGPSPAKIAKM